MVFLVGLLTAAQIVGAQGLWKHGVNQHHFELTPGFLLSADGLRFAASLWVLAGLALYTSATLTFMGLLARYDYTVVQTVVVSSSLVLTFLSAAVFFDESVRFVHLIGLGFLLVGVVLVTQT